MSGRGERLRQLEESFIQRLGGVGEILRFDNRIQLLYQRFFSKRSRLVVYRLGDIEAVADISGGDVNSVRSCLASPMYRALLSGLKLPDELTVLDLGANSGGFPLLLLSLGHKIQSLVCVELNSRTALRLRYNLQANLPLSSRWAVREAAILGSQRTLKLYLGRGSTGDNVYERSQTDQGEEVEVDGITLDDCIDRNFGSTPIDLCKMDIEGAEYEVFESNTYGRLGQCRYLLIEIHATELPRRDRLFEQLDRSGFALVAGPDDRRFGVEYCFKNTRTD